MAHSSARLLLIMSTWMSYLAFLVVLFTNITKQVPEMFNSDLVSQMKKFPHPIALAKWTYYIFVLIWIWQFTWLCYVISAIFRKIDVTDKIYIYQTDVVEHSVYISFGVSNSMLIAWTFLFDNNYIVVATVALLLASCSLIMGAFKASCSMYRHLDYFQKSNIGKDVWIVRALLHNGIMGYIVLLSLVLFQSFGIVLTYFCRVKLDISAFVTVVLFTLVILTWFYLDVSIFDKFVRYTVTPYFIAVYIVAGAMTETFSLAERPVMSVYLTALLSILCLMTLTKVILVVWRHQKYPIRNQYSYNVNNDNNAVV